LGLRRYESFEQAAMEAGQSRIYGGIHFQFDNQSAQASGRALGQYVVGNFLLPVEEEKKGAGGDAGGRAATRAGGQLRLVAGPNNASVESWVVLLGQLDSAPAAGPSRREAPPRATEVLVAPSADSRQPSEHDGASDRLAARALRLRALDQALAGLDD